jgi:HlyD family secretion protein
VREGTLERKVRGPGLLQPREARWLSTRVDARVDRLLVRAGEAVEPDTVIVQLSNPEVERAADAAVLEVAAARAEYAAAKLESQSQRLDQRSSLAEARATAESARLQAVAEETAFVGGAVSELQYSRSKILAAQLGERVAIEEQRLAALDSSVSAQLEARLARLRQLERTLQERQLAAESLQVRAGMSGVVQSIAVQEGQQLAPGANVARVAKPDTLYAELRIPELDARDLAAGQAATIDMRDRIVRGRVVRVDPAVVAGAVRVEIDFDEALPSQARADLSVDGTVAIETLEHVRYVGRPVGAQSESTTTVFRAGPGRERGRARAREIREGVRQPDRRARGPRARRHRRAGRYDAVVGQGPTRHRLKQRSSKTCRNRP